MNSSRPQHRSALDLDVCASDPSSASPISSQQWPPSSSKSHLQDFLSSFDSLRPQPSRSWSNQKFLRINGSYNDDIVQAETVDDDDEADSMLSCSDASLDSLPAFHLHSPVEIRSSDTITHRITLTSPSNENMLDDGGKVTDEESKGIEEELLRLTQSWREGVLSPHNLMNSSRIRQVGLGLRGRRWDDLSQSTHHFTIPAGPAPTGETATLDRPNTDSPSHRQAYESLGRSLDVEQTNVEPSDSTIRFSDPSIPLIKPRPIHAWTAST